MMPYLRTTILTVLLLFGAAAVAIIRTGITPRLTNIPSFELSYEAVCHCVAAGCILIGAWDWDSRLGPSRVLFWTGWGISLWELGWFLTQKHMAGL